MKRRGFTLVELLVVLVIAVILLVIAVPGYVSLVNSSRLTSTTNDLILALHLARSEAIKRGTRVTVCKSSNPGASVPTCDSSAKWEQGWLLFIDNGVRGAIDTDDTVLLVHESIAEWAVISAVNFNLYFSYLPTGASRGSTGLGNDTIKICVSGERRDIIVNTVGRPRVRSGTC